MSKYWKHRVALMRNKLRGFLSAPRIRCARLEGSIELGQVPHENKESVCNLLRSWLKGERGNHLGKMLHVCWLDHFGIRFVTIRIEIAHWASVPGGTVTAISYKRCSARTCETCTLLNTNSWRLGYASVTVGNCFVTC